MVSIYVRDLFCESHKEPTGITYVPELPTVVQNVFVFARTLC